MKELFAEYFYQLARTLLILIAIGLLILPLLLVGFLQSWWYLLAYILIIPIFKLEGR